MSKVFLFLGTFQDKSYLPRLKPLVGDATVFVSLDSVSTWTEIELYCKKRNITGIISTSQALLKILLRLEYTGKQQPSIDNYAGSFFSKSGLDIVFIDPLAQLITVPYGAFLTRRYISKLLAPQTWLDFPKFSWTLLTPENLDSAFHTLSTSDFIAVDIETKKDPLSITCISYTGITFTHNEIKSNSYVLPIDSSFSLVWMRKINWETRAPKILQNGKYDLAYLHLYSAPLYNYLWDTATMFHAWYAELPKDLGFLGAFCIRTTRYWKDLSKTNDLMEYYKYNALDTYNTALVFLTLINEMPDWARQNYLLEFPLLFPCHLSELTGIKRDLGRLKAASTEIETKISEATSKLNRILGTTNFNTNSPKQVLTLIKILGCGDIESTNEKDLVKAAYRHPFNARLINLILDIRGWRKLSSTYLVEGKEYKGRILYSINPHGTDTGRCASKEHHFWCGLQVQNIPRGKEVKQTLCADPDFLLAEVDLEQAESRDTAHIAGDESLISAVSGTKDFHSVNASAFFGIPYEEIYSDEKGKTLNKSLRDLAKRVNHGANYNMGANTLVDTMGEEKVREAQRLLGLPKLWSLKQVAEYLLSVFHKTYGNIAGKYYPKVIHDVRTTQKLSGATGWTRFCFGKPWENKLHLNAYVAHCPQSLNAMTLNKAFMRVFYELAMHQEHGKHFKLCAQIHDSILFQFRIGHEYLAEQVKLLMEIPIENIVGADGNTRTFTVPAAIKAGKDGKGTKYWSDTE